MAMRSTWSPNFDSLVRAGDQGIALGNNSLSIWARFDDFNNNYEAIEINGNGYSFGSALILNGNQVEFSQRSSSAQINFVAGGTLTANTWYHLALTYDGTTLRGYINGAQVGTNTGLTGTRGNWFDLQIGPALGYLENAMFFTRALTPEEIADLYAQCTPRSPSGLRHWLPLFPGSNRLVDLSGNALNFTNSGTPTDPGVTVSLPPIPWGEGNSDLILPSSSAISIAGDGSVQCTGAATMTKEVLITAAGMVSCTGSANVAPPMAAAGSVQCTGAAAMTKSVLITADGLVSCSGAAAMTESIAITADGMVRTSGMAVVNGNAPPGAANRATLWRRGRDRGGR